MTSSKFSVESKKLGIVGKYDFSQNLPPEILLSFYNPFKNLYIGIFNKNLNNYPTFRCSTRFNKGINIFGSEINVIKLNNFQGVKFPPYLMSGKSGNSNLNVSFQNLMIKDQFMEYLGYAIDLKKSNINKYNFAIDESMTQYISKKIYVI